MLSKTYYKFFERLAFSLLFIISIRRFIRGVQISLEPGLFRNVIVEVILWVLIVLIFLWFMKHNGEFNNFLSLFRLNWPILVFMGIAILSLLWSVNFPVTLYKVFVLIAATTSAAYIGVSNDVGDFLNKLAWFWGIVAAISFYAGIAYPEFGTHIGHPYFGAWRGIFWNRGGLGSFIVFANLVFLFQVARFLKNPVLLIVNSIFYLLTFALVILTKSATAVILLVVLHGAFVLAVLWMKFRDKLTKWHYLAFGALALVLSFVVLTNLEFIFGLLGRETNLTGRVPMWEYLLQDVFVQKPILGFGFSTIWDYNNFRFYMQNIVGWPYPVLIADNGFIDLLLNLGVVGELSFLAVFVLMFVRAFRYALQRGDVLKFFPLLLMVYALVVNLSLSRMFEIEFFVWLLVASTLFITTPRSAA